MLRLRGQCQKGIPTPMYSISEVQILSLRCSSKPIVFLLKFYLLAIIFIKPYQLK